MNKKYKLKVEENSKWQYLGFSSINREILLTLKCECGNIFLCKEKEFDKGINKCSLCQNKKAKNKIAQKDGEN